MTCHCSFAPAGTPAVAKHLVARLLGKGLPAAIVIMTEELANLKMQDYPFSKDRHILYRPEIPAVYLVAGMTTIRTDAIVQRG